MNFMQFKILKLIFNKKVYNLNVGKVIKIIIIGNDEFS